MPKHLFNASRLEPIQVDSLQTPFLFLSAIGKVVRKRIWVSQAYAKCLVQPTARCHQGQSCFRAASNSGAQSLLCMQMQEDIIKKAIEIAVSNPSTVNRYFPLCSSEEISINMPKAQDCSRNLLLPTILFLSPSLRIT